MCDLCDGATLDEIRLNLARKIDDYGWAIQSVAGGRHGIGWSYTIGLAERFDHPELVVAGPDHPLDRAGLLGAAITRIRAGERFAAGDEATLIEVPHRFVDVHPRQFTYGVFAMWFLHYRNLPELAPELTALQVVVPDDQCCADCAALQPPLDQPHDVLAGGGNRASRRAAGRRRPRGR